jgi:hypothetical protein
MQDKSQNDNNLKNFTISNSINKRMSNDTTIYKSNEKKMNKDNKNYINQNYSENFSTNRNFDKLITKSKNINIKNNNSFDNLFLNNKNKENKKKSHNFKDVSSIKNYAIATSKNTFEYINDNLKNINYDKSLENIFDLFVKIIVVIVKFIIVLFWNVNLLFKKVLLNIIKYINNIFVIWRKKNGFNDLETDINSSVKINNNQIYKTENNNINFNYNTKTNNMKDIYEKEKEKEKENVNFKKKPNNKFFDFLNNNFNPFNNFFNNSFPEANVSINNSIKINKPNNKQINTKKNQKNIIRQPYKNKGITPNKIMKYYPIKLNGSRSYNSQGKRIYGRTKINLKVNKKLARELREQLEYNNLKSRKNVKKKLNEMYSLLKNQ